MYVRSPMEKFNSSNPFIIICKKKYDEIVDLLQLFVKKSIKSIIINSIIGLITFIAYWYVLYLTRYNQAKPLIIMIFILIINILSAIWIKNKIVYFLSKHPQMQEFSRISELEINDILALNNEDVLKCSNGLYEIKGELLATIKYSKWIFGIIGFIELFMLESGFNIITSFMI